MARLSRSQQFSPQAPRKAQFSTTAPATAESYGGSGSCSSSSSSGGGKALITTKAARPRRGYSSIRPPIRAVPRVRCRAAPRRIVGDPTRGLRFDCGCQSTVCVLSSRLRMRTQLSPPSPLPPYSHQPPSTPPGTPMLRNEITTLSHKYCFTIQQWRIIYIIVSAWTETLHAPHWPFCDRSRRAGID